jgi:hypothetical protein
MKEQYSRQLSVSEGDVLTVDVLEWVDPYWEFDNLHVNRMKRDP